MRIDFYYVSIQGGYELFLFVQKEFVNGYLYFKQMLCPDFFHFFVRWPFSKGKLSLENFYGRHHFTFIKVSHTLIENLIPCGFRRLCCFDVYIIIILLCFWCKFWIRKEFVTIASMHRNVLKLKINNPLYREKCLL